MLLVFLPNVLSSPVVVFSCIYCTFWGFGGTGVPVAEFQKQWQFPQIFSLIYETAMWNIIPPTQAQQQKVF